MKNIYPCLWFDDNAEEAVNFYKSVFKNTVIDTITRYDEASAEASGRPVGTVLTISFRIDGKDYMALNGGPIFKFTPAISLFVTCKSAEEVDQLWNSFSPGGQVLMELGSYPFSERYGWIQDKYGLSWQLFMGDSGKSITPLLMFAGSQRGRAEEAMKFYISLFKNSEFTRIERYGKDEGDEGKVKHAMFKLLDQDFMAMDSHNEAVIEFNDAFSFVVNCDTQAEIDVLWEKLTTGGAPVQCGWLKDRFGVSWQIVPSIMDEMMRNPDPEKTANVMKALLSMVKLDIKTLEDAYNKK